MDFLEHGGYSSFPIRREWQSRFSRGRSSRCLSEPNPNGILRYKFLDKGIPLGHSPLLSAFSSIMEPLHVSSLAVELLNLVRRTLSHFCATALETEVYSNRLCPISTHGTFSASAESREGSERSLSLQRLPACGKSRSNLSACRHALMTSPSPHISPSCSTANIVYVHLYSLAYGPGS